MMTAASGPVHAGGRVYEQRPFVQQDGALGLGLATQQSFGDAHEGTGAGLAASALAPFAGPLPESLNPESELPLATTASSEPPWNGPVWGSHAARITRATHPAERLARMPSSCHVRQRLATDLPDALGDLIVGSGDNHAGTVQQRASGGLF
jgi:hypothetical protein